MDKMEVELRAALLLAAEALREAAEEIEAWGAYANPYFQKKHDLPSHVRRARRAAEATGKAALGEQVPVKE